jgi:hypothetical protein
MAPESEVVGTICKSYLGCSVGRTGLVSHVDSSIRKITIPSTNGTRAGL